jgi:hypothetical protein
MDVVEPEEEENEVTETVEGKEPTPKNNPRRKLRRLAKPERSR